jgi:hypothetical protein
MTAPARVYSPNGDRPPAIDQPPAGVLVVVADSAQLDTIRRILQPHYDVVTARTRAAALRICAQTAIAVAIVDPAVPGCRGQSLLAELATLHPRPELVALPLAPDSHSRGNDDEVVFYIVPRLLAPADLVPIVRGAVAHYQDVRAAREADGDFYSQVAHKQQIADLACRLALQRDSAAACRLLASAAPELIVADRITCAIYSAVGQLWTYDDDGVVERQWRALEGLLGFVARTGAAAQLARASADPRYAQPLDDPAGAGDERLLAVPILDDDGRAMAVLLAIRAAARPPFSAEDGAKLSRLARASAPAFGHLALAAGVVADDVGLQPAWRGATPDLFRAEALAYYTAGSRDRGSPLRITPGWARWLAWLLLAVFAAGLLFALVGMVDQYASGPAVVRIEPAGGVLVAALPGEYRPLLRPGMPLRLELAGYRYAYQPLAIDTIEDRLVGPAEAQRALGPALALPAGPVVLVRARLLASTFAADGGAYSYYDGMTGAVEVRLRSERILYTLVPGLNVLFGDWR